MSRQTRQSAILSIIASQEIETQDELVTELRRKGYEITQATISRDIKELGLIKTLTSDNKYKYVTKQFVDAGLSGKLLSVVRETVISVVTAENLVVVKTVGDSAGVVAGAIEQLSIGEVLGILADKNTILIVCETSRDAMTVKEKVNRLL